MKELANPLQADNKLNINDGGRPSEITFWEEISNHPAGALTILSQLRKAPLEVLGSAKSILILLITAFFDPLD
ncbi:hypothetical protein AXFE_12430 [Acidithrix ferrooxidans]|uniref:Uncharacterized protein n=1 Tax=Acidithrix ferrooxidans TaxID=1280514 RepID=A0A0D8HJ62_9ACTN|nr:hypothetical protein AXFE_12430 [Acidithrix ferrooxidans]